MLPSLAEGGLGPCAEAAKGRVRGRTVTEQRREKEAAELAAEHARLTARRARLGVSLQSTLVPELDQLRTANGERPMANGQWRRPVAPRRVKLAVERA